MFKKKSIMSLLRIGCGLRVVCRSTLRGESESAQGSCLLTVNEIRVVDKAGLVIR